MHVVLLGAGVSIHCIKIANGLVQRGHRVSLVTLPSHAAPEGSYDPMVEQHLLPRDGYFFQGRALKKIFREVSGDVVYAHYATGYGTILRQSGIHPSVLAVWGSDIYDFPGKSPAHRWLVRDNLRFPDALFSTSYVMAEAAQKILPCSLRITPFGVDMQRFSPETVLAVEGQDAHGAMGLPPEVQAQLPAEDGRIHIGFIKGLSEKYGLRYLMEAVARFMDSEAEGIPFDLCLDVYGRGDGEPALRQLSKDLKIEDRVIFHGAISNAFVPEVLHRVQLFCAPSTLDSESFGVSAVEAMACGVPAIVSDVDGFREVTAEGTFAVMVPRKNAEALETAIRLLLNEPQKAQEMAKQARDHVAALYDWNENIQNIAEGLQCVVNGGVWLRDEDFHARRVSERP